MSAPQTPDVYSSLQAGGARIYSMDKPKSFMMTLGKLTGGKGVSRGATAEYFGERSTAQKKREWPEIMYSSIS